MKNKHKVVLLALVVVIALLSVLTLSIKPPKQEKVNEPVVEEVQVVERASCVDDAELEAWFKERLDEEAAWQKVNYRFYFTAKRMAAEPWTAHQDVIALEPDGGASGIMAYNKSDRCEVETVKRKQELWDQWHDARMLSLEVIKGAYPKIKEAG